MEMDKMMRGKVLDDLMKDMDDFTFEKKLKPKVISITIDASGAGGMPPEMAEGPEMSEEMEEGEMPEEEGEAGMDPRLMKLLRAKLG
jgi:hypothetical protein